MKINFSKQYTFIPTSLGFRILSFCIYAVVYVILQTISILFYSRRFVNRKETVQFLKKQGCITISNHCHVLDAPFVSIFLYPQILYISMMQINAERFFVGTLLKFLRAFPIPASISAIKMINKPIGDLLRQGKHVHFLAEGHLKHLNQKMQRLQLGGFQQAYIHQCPILPMVFVLRRRKFLKWNLPKNFVTMKIVYGDPIYPPSYDREKGNAVLKDELTDLATQARNWMQTTMDRG